MFVWFNYLGCGMNNKLKLNIDTTLIAEKLIASGDLNSRSCCCGEGHGDGDISDVDNIIELVIDTIENFGEAGLRALSDRAKARADGLPEMF